MRTACSLILGAPSGSFSPAQLANGKHWLDGADLSTMWTTSARTTPASDGSAVGSWLDKIGGLYWAQTASGRCPTVSVALKGLNFDGSDDYMNSPLSAITWPKVAGSDINIFVIATADAVTNTRYLFSFGASVYPGEALLITSSKLLSYIGNGSSAYAIATPASNNVTTATKFMAEYAFNNAADTLVAKVNNTTPVGTASYTSTVGYSASDAISCIGGSSNNDAVAPIYLHDGRIHEIVVTAGITAGERTDLLKFFQTKHGLSLGV